MVEWARFILYKTDNNHPQYFIISMTLSYKIPRVQQISRNNNSGLQKFQRPAFISLFFLSFPASTTDDPPDPPTVHLYVNLDKYALKLKQIQFSIWTNTLLNFDKYI